MRLQHAWAGTALPAFINLNPSCSVRKRKLTKVILCPMKVFLWKFYFPLRIKLSTGPCPPPQNTHSRASNLYVLNADGAVAMLDVVCMCASVWICQCVTALQGAVGGWEDAAIIHCCGVRPHTYQQMTSVRQGRSQACNVCFLSQFTELKKSCRQAGKNRTPWGRLASSHAVLVAFWGLGQDVIFTSWRR